MKLHLIKSSLAAFTVLSLVSQPLSQTFAQGSLTSPPGAPSAMMKSLDQIEPRIAISNVAGSGEAMHVIHQRGNYYLTGDIVATAGKHGIQINAPDVTIDLNGFTLIGTGEADRHGITLLNDDGGDGANLSVRNGRIRNWSGAIQYFSRGAGVLEDLQIENCRYGIHLSEALRVSRCQVMGNGASRGGIVLNYGNSFVQDCRVKGLSSTEETYGIHLDRGMVVRCVVTEISGSALSRGIWIKEGDSTVSDCSVFYVSTSSTGKAIGIEAAAVRNCTVSLTYGLGNASHAVGIVGRHVERCSVINTTGGSSSGSAAGIRAKDSSALIQQCFVDGSSAAGAFGIDADTNACSIINSKVSNISGNGSSSYGIRAKGGAASILGCNVNAVTNSNYAWGIYVEGGLVERCNVTEIRNAGIYANGGTSVLNCHVRLAGQGSDAAGIWASSTRNRIEGNHVSECDMGIQVNSGSSAVFLRNVCQNNTTNYSVAGAPVAPIVNAAGAATATNPLVNLSL